MVLPQDPSTDLKTIDRWQASRTVGQEYAMRASLRVARSRSVSPTFSARATFIDAHNRSVADLPGALPAPPPQYKRVLEYFSRYGIR